jgi:hypothetical protein
MPSQIRRWGHETHIPPAYPECMSSGLARTIRAAFEAGVTQPPAPRPHWLRRGRLDFVAIADAVIAAVSFGLTNSALGALNAQHGHPHSVQELLLVSFLLCAPLLLRNRFPLSAWSASALAMILTNLLIHPQSLGFGPLCPGGGHRLRPVPVRGGGPLHGMGRG